MAIVRALGCLSHGQKGKYINIKKIVVDLPLSQSIFQSSFPVDYTGEESFKENVHVDQLNTVFGQNWHVYHFPNSSTRNRVIGLVLLHFRKKKFDVWCDSDDIR